MCGGCGGSPPYGGYPLHGITPGGLGTAEMVVTTITRMLLGGRKRDGVGLKCRSSSGGALSMKEGHVTDENRFTRETWRRGGRSRLRKRTKPWGGCKTAPPAFLEAAKVAGFKPGRPGYRVCGAIKRNGDPCKRLAMKELATCEAHGGFSVLARRGELQASGRTAMFKATRAAAVEGRAPQVSLDLIRLPIYQQANDWIRIRLARAWGTNSWPALIWQIQHQDI
jgi:hypothetical protein